MRDTPLSLCVTRPRPGKLSDPAGGVRLGLCVARPSSPSDSDYAWRVPRARQTRIMRGASLEPRSAQHVSLSLPPSLDAVLPSIFPPFCQIVNRPLLSSLTPSQSTTLGTISLPRISLPRPFSHCYSFASFPCCSRSCAFPRRTAGRLAR
jgi:hypothetical protein